MPSLLDQHINELLSNTRTNLLNQLLKQIDVLSSIYIYILEYHISDYYDDKNINNLLKKKIEEIQYDIQKQYCNSLYNIKIK